MCMKQTCSPWPAPVSPDLNRHLSQYVQCEKKIPKLQERLGELKGARRIVNGSPEDSGWDEGQWIKARTIDLQILYLEECLKNCLMVKDNVESAIAAELNQPRYRRFIGLYWGGSLNKTEARKLVMGELNLSKTTFYRWRRSILSKIAGTGRTAGLLVPAANLDPHL